MILAKMVYIHLSEWYHTNIMGTFLAFPQHHFDLTKHHENDILQFEKKYKK